MRSYPLAEARADFSRIVDRALAGEPQRVTRRGREAVVIVSEADWHGRERRPRDESAPAVTSLADALIALAAVDGLTDLIEDGRDRWSTSRPLGRDFVED